MKKTMLTGLLFCIALLNAAAQTKAHSQNAAPKKSMVKGKAPKTTKDSTVVLADNNAYPAFAPKSGTELRISDPTIIRLNERASGATVPKSSSGIIGMSKHSNGFANGHVLLRNTTASSGGTLSGSGAVGTGTSIQGVGTSETSIGVNGKSPYAGPSLWGDKKPIYTTGGSDSARHQ